MARVEKTFGQTMENEEGVRRVPLTILTGWLGSGKTTLMHHVLNTLGAAGLKVAWVQNTGPEPIIILVCIRLRSLAMSFAFVPSSREHGR